MFGLDLHIPEHLGFYLKDFQVGKNFRDNTEFLHVGSIVELSEVEAYLCEQVNRGLKCQYKAAFACRLAYSAPKPFNDNVFLSLCCISISCFLGKLTTSSPYRWSL